MQWIFRWHVNIRRHGKVHDHNTIMNWVEKFCITASATNKNPWGTVRTMWTPEILKGYKPLLVTDPNDQHANILLPSIYWKDHFNRYCILTYIINPIKYRLCKNCQTMSLLQEECFASNLLMLDEAHFELSACVNK
jgi:hypothetical protein